MKKKFRWLIIGGLFCAIALLLFKDSVFNPNPTHKIGEAIDELNGVKIYYNGMVGHTGDRNSAADGYNIGITYQCVEFVKRYYCEHYHHKMPDSYGNAKDFFNASVGDGGLNKERDLLQFKNPSATKIHAGDIIIFDQHYTNAFGHVAIVSSVNGNEFEIAQQNPGPFASSRVKLTIDSSSSGFKVNDERCLGWLRLK
jgi:surface antigen